MINKLSATATTLLSVLFVISVSAQTTGFIGMTTAGGVNGIAGGLNGVGTIFSFNPSTGRDTFLWSFGGGDQHRIDGTYPHGNLVYDPSNSRFYAMTQQSEGYGADLGTIISFDPATNTEQVVWSFRNDSLDGGGPWGSLTYDVNHGIFYGMTSAGGEHNKGTIFSFDPSTNMEHTLYSFAGYPTDGNDAYGNLVFSTSTGLYYGMTAEGGQYNGGVLFSFDPSTNVENVILSFNVDTTIGGYPKGSLTYNPNNGLFYGMTGGSNYSYYHGSIFSFDPSTNNVGLVWAFENDSDGAYPAGNLVYNSTTGLLYGTTEKGGKHNFGSIISFNPSIGRDSILYSFLGNGNAANPRGSLVYDASNGLYYGTTSGEYSTLDSGSIFSFNPSTNIVNPEVVKFRLRYAQGWALYGDLISYTIPTGISEINKSSINIFPNPTNGLLTITGLIKGQSIILYNAIGQNVASIIASSTIQQIDISAQADGIYLIQVLNEDNTVISQKKVIKSN